jgi:DNA-binding response OmpR family regulator
MASRILIVDDEPAIVEYLAEVLHGLGYVTATAGDGREALERIATEVPDLVLLDWVMPIMDGLQVCRALKENDRTRLIPVVIMTSLDGMDSRIKGIEAGADDFLTKPLNERQLIARVQTALRLKNAVDRKLGELRRVRDHFAKFVPEAVKRLVAADPEAPVLRKRERDVSVLFVDLSGYTALSEQLAAEALNALIERYFSRFLDSIHDGGGDINETAGDGFMAIFEDPDPQTHAVRAIDAALGLRDTASRLNRESGETPLDIHMGINSGIALVGSTRFEGLHGARWTFTASGPVTNMAARLAGAAGPNELFVGPETMRRVGSRYEHRRRKGKFLKDLEGVQPYEVLGPAPARS